MNKSGRYFIAGARCPKCGNYDSIYFVDRTYQSFACVDCQYQSTAIDERTPEAKPKMATKAETQKIKIIETDGKTKT